MEQDHVLFETISKLQAGTAELSQSNAKISDLQHELHGAHHELEEAKKRQETDTSALINAIHNTDKLTTLEKTAWLTAINLPGGHMSDLEQRAQQYINCLEKLNRIFAQSDVPFMAIWRGYGVYPSISTFFTSESTGDATASNHHTWVVYGKNSTEQTEEDFPYYIDIEQIAGVFELPEELEEFDYENFLDSDTSFTKLVIFVAGQETIASLANTLVNDALDGDVKYGLDIAEKAQTIGIEVPSVSDVLRVMQEEKTQRLAADLGKRIVYEIGIGRMNAARELAARYKELNITPEQLVKNMRQTGAVVAIGIDQIAAELEPQFAQPASLDGPLHPTTVPAQESEDTPAD